MGIANDVYRLAPHPVPSSPREPDRFVSVRSGGTFTPERVTFRRRIEAFCRLNHPALVLVIGVSPDGSHLQGACHPSLAHEMVDAALSIAVSEVDGLGSTPGSLTPESLDRFLDGLTDATEQAFLALDHRGLHCFGRRALFGEGLYLYRKSRGVTE